MKNWNIVVADEPWDGRVGVMIYHEAEQGGRYIFRPVLWELEYRAEGEMAGEPTMRLPRYAASALLHALEKSGIKIQSQSFIEGELIATKRHLADVRQIAKLK